MVAARIWLSAGPLTALRFASQCARFGRWRGGSEMGTPSKINPKVRPNENHSRQTEKSAGRITAAIFVSLGAAAPHGYLLSLGYASLRARVDARWVPSGGILSAWMALRSWLDCLTKFTSEITTGAGAWRHPGERTLVRAGN